MATGTRLLSRLRGRDEGPGGATRVHDRFAERAATVRRRPRRLVLWSAVVAALVTAVAVLLLWSPAFVVEEVTVQGVEGPRADSALADAAIPTGQPLARVDTQEAAGRVEQDVRVAEATVDRDWPSGVTVEVRSRVPAVAIDAAGSSTYDLADSGGVVFETVAERPEGIPVVQVGRGEASAGGLAGALDLLAALPDDLTAEIGAVRLDRGGGLRFDLGDLAVRWGGAEDAELKARVLSALLAQDQIDPAGEQPITIDLAVPGTPVVTGLTPAAAE